MKTVKITGNNVWASPDGIRVLKYDDGFVTEFADEVADALVKSKQAEEAEGAEHTETQPVPAVEDVARPGESVTGGDLVASRAPAVAGPNALVAGVDKQAKGGPVAAAGNTSTVDGEQHPNSANTPVASRDGKSVVNDGSTPQTRTAATEGPKPEGQPARTRDKPPVSS
jgi:hypothetical protein